MSNILDRYGIKEVADVTFYALNDSGVPTYPVLYLDTLKVSTIEQTAESSDARGGKGNGILVSWDYGKEINVTLEDALFSAKSMAVMFGNGTVSEYTGNIMKTENFIATGSNTTPAEVGDPVYDTGWNSKFTGPDGKVYTKLNPKFYDAKGATVVIGDGEGEVDNLTAGDTYFCSYDLAATGGAIEVSANSFPGTYYVTGDTYARSDKAGRDEFFQFIIPKAKVTSENTITLEAEGDPSVFNMSLKVMRPADGVMMKLVKYDLSGGADAEAGEGFSMYHNHILNPKNMS